MIVINCNVMVFPYFPHGIGVLYYVLSTVNFSNRSYFLTYYQHIQQQRHRSLWLL